MFFPFAKIVWLLLQPSSALIIVLLAGLGLTWTRFARAGRFIALLAALMLLIAGLSPLGNWLILPLEERFSRTTLSPSEPPTGLIVLGGAQDTLVSQARGVIALNEAGERLVDAAALARSYPQAKLVFTGGSGRLIYEGETEAKAADALFQGLGIDKRRLLLEDQARDTYENALYTKKLVNPRAGERWLLITSAAHMPRAMGSFRKAGFEVLPWPVDYRTRGPADAMRFFGKPSEGLRRVDAAVREWAGLAAYYLTGRSNALFPSP
jgi:uncharacterized SAM-binding protein YcdF (DUF218 family)